MENRTNRLGVKRKEERTQNRTLRDSSEAIRFRRRFSPSYSVSVAFEVGCEQGEFSRMTTEDREAFIAV